MAASRSNELTALLGRLEAAYGVYVTPADPVEAGVMALLASQAPAFASEASRDRLREAFVDWNEARVADPWDVTVALEAVGDASARQFARSLLRYLESLHGAINRCSFVVPDGEPRPDWPALVEKVRAAPPEVRVCILAMLPESGGWHLTSDMARIAVKLGLCGKTTSPAKAAQSLAESCGESDRMRLHYLLCRYAARGKDDPDPLSAAEARGKKPAKAKKDAAPATKTPAKAKGGAK